LGDRLIRLHPFALRRKAFMVENGNFVCLLPFYCPSPSSSPPPPRSGKPSIGVSAGLVQWQSVRTIRIDCCVIVIRSGYITAEREGYFIRRAAGERRQKCRTALERSARWVHWQSVRTIRLDCFVIVSRSGYITTERDGYFGRGEGPEGRRGLCSGSWQRFVRSDSIAS
jgi:hypothetical protein